MLSLRDIDSLKNMAHILLWPLGAASIYSTFGIVGGDRLPAEGTALFYPAFVLAFVVQAIMCTLLIELIEISVGKLDDIGAPWVEPVLAIAVLTVGVLPLAEVGETAESSISPIWAIFCLAWGFKVFLPEQSKS